MSRPTEHVATANGALFDDRRQPSALIDRPITMLAETIAASLG